MGNLWKVFFARSGVVIFLVLLGLFVVGASMASAGEPDMDKGSVAPEEKVMNIEDVHRRKLLVQGCVVTGTYVWISSHAYLMTLVANVEASCGADNDWTVVAEEFAIYANDIYHLEPLRHLTGIAGSLIIASDSLESEQHK